MLIAKTAVAAILSTVVLVPLIAFLYLKAITHGQPGLIAVSGGAGEAVLLSSTVLLATAVLWYWILH